MATINGTNSNDTLTSTFEDDTINGFGGNDTINFPASSRGDDLVDGGTGNDSLFFNFAGAVGVTVDFSAGTAIGGGTVSFTNIERVVATLATDHLIGAAGSQNLSGVGGHDTLEGREGNDWLWGGAGNDVFVFRETGTANADNIGDFSGAADTIVLDGTVMTALGAEGQFAAGDTRFVANASGTAQESSDRVVYNTTTRQLFYDADGDGSGTAQLIATLQAGATISATNIVVEGGSSSGGATEGDDVLVGTEGPDTIDGLGGNDHISGLGGNDHLIGGTGNDTLDGGAGADALEGGLGDDTYRVDAADSGAAVVDTGGMDTVIAINTGWVLGTGFENLRLERPSGSFQLAGIGNELDNTIVTDDHAYLLDGADGDDTLLGGAGSQDFRFASGSGSYGNDIVDGGDGADTLYLGARSGVHVDFRTGSVSGGGVGGSGSIAFQNIEVARTGAFADTVIADDSNIFADLGLGNDVFVGGAGFNHVWDGEVESGSGSGNDQISGGAGLDQITIGGGDDTVDAGTDDDIIMIAAFRGYGTDVIDGGDGVDELVVLQSASFAIDLQAGTLVGGGPDGGSASLFSIENVSVSGQQGFDLDITGSGVANRVFSSFGNDTLLGLGGDDWIVGSGGIDTINGGAGNDRLQGLGGSARFVFDQAPGTAHADVIEFFASGSDQLHLSLDVMTELGAPGPLGSGDDRFHAAPGAVSGADPEDRVIHNTTTGEVFYDADGNGADAALLIATLQGAPALSATDIVVVADGSGEHIVGTEGDDDLVGTNGDDLIEGLGGNDRLSGGLGEDELRGGDGNDWLSGAESSGDDALDILDGGMGDDDYFIYLVADSIVDAGGIDTVHVSRMDWTLGAGLENLVMNDDPSGGGFHGTGNELDNVIQGSFEGGTMRGMGGNDTLRGSPDSALIGGDGNDMLEGGRRLFGDAGDDVLRPGATSFGAIFDLTGGTGADTFVLEQAGTGDSYVILDLASGVDTIRLDATGMPALGASGEFSAGDARFSSGAGVNVGQDPTDRVVYNTSTGQLWYDADGSGAGGALLIATLQAAPSLAATDIEVVNGTAPGEHIVGTSGNDSLMSTPGDNTMEGLGGNDTFNFPPGYGDDSVDGGTGADSLFFNFAGATAITADFASGSATGSGGSVAFVNVERVVATLANDHLVGTSGAQNLSGVGGHDTLEGSTGNDWLWGGAGNDTFIFRENGAANADNLGDFGSNFDTIALDNAAMAALGADGDFVAGDARFTANSSGTAQDGADRVVYNTSTGQLYYDADGSGAGVAQLIATIQGAPGVSATDISVV